MMLDEYTDIAARRENLANLRRAKREHCKALELLNQLERAEMDAIREIEDGVRQQMTGAIMEAVTVKTVYLN